jgi:hypothetical protein
MISPRYMTNQPQKTQRHVPMFSRNIDHDAFTMPSIENGIEGD